MKCLFALLTVLGACSLQAQSTNAAVTKSAALTNPAPIKTYSGLEAQTGPQNERTVNLGQLKPNEIARGNVIFSGIAVQVAKKGKPLQLINPLAPPQYGSPEDNIVRQPQTALVPSDLPNGRPPGLKIFAIRF